MRLKKIKLAGFKTFVDPVTIHLQSHLTGVVGPNGCGKSNIIDAVRWVMGEISAKQLRGEAMSDVIFNGSSARKPVGQAAVELIFDNSDASLGGEYAQYHEISVRRQVTRDEASDYFLNNTRCRRRDITDIFCGTGLGPHSYAIIEQGMISQLIEAKPDELRVYIEEAAGISKYKERRRETENRIKHTKENLSRINDIREELGRQLKHLKSQANAANRYKILKQEERLTKAQLLAMHYRELDKKSKQQEDFIVTEEARLTDKTVEQNAQEAKIDALRQKHSSDLETFNAVQARYYQVGSNIARIEQQIKHSKERHEQLIKDLEQIDQVWQETISHKNTDQEQLTMLDAEKAKLVVAMEAMAQQTQATKQELITADQAMQNWQERWDEFNAWAAQVTQRLEVEQTRIQHLNQRIKQESETLERLNKELINLNFAPLITEIAELTGKHDTVKLQYENLHAELATKQQQITVQREQNKNLASELDILRSNTQKLLGKSASLEALQQAALGKNDAVLIDWLKARNLNEKPRLAQGLKVAAGWETAVETVLGTYLEAVCVDDFNSIAAMLKSLAHGNLVLFDVAAASDNIDNSSSEQFKDVATLSSKINSDWSIINLLHGIYVADSLEAALALRAELRPHQSVITKDGIWLGNSWLRAACNVPSEKTGFLQRKRELQDLNSVITHEQELIKQKEQQLQQQQALLIDLEKQHHELQQQLRDATSAYSSMQSQLSAKRTHLDHLRQREQAVKREIADHEQLVNSDREHLAAAQASWQEAAAKKNTDDEKRQDLLQQRGECQQRLEKARQAENQHRQNVNNSNMRLQLLQSQLDYLQQNLERAEQRLVGLKEHRANIDHALQQAIAPVGNLEQELTQELATRLTVEHELAAAKQQVAIVEHDLRELEKKRSMLQEEAKLVGAHLEKLRLERQSLQVRCTTYLEQIDELDYKLEALYQEIPEAATLDEWEQKLARLGERIIKLGAINLAAIDEFTKLQERKDYLDKQNQDLVDALNTLEQAIHKIDRDTRERFKDTFNSINEKFQELFPKIFNGGKAYLELTGDDLLETGAMILAQPPGKRNSSIHLLSGGEKALTAIALVFSIFQLNPAPFCMLDEVDAPLDDLNTVRFCNLVKEMSKTIQFIFVTHNKQTMETAEQLAGITMQEPGVSRIVTVDINAAVAMAAK